MFKVQLPNFLKFVPNDFKFFHTNYSYPLITNTIRKYLACWKYILSCKNHVTIRTNDMPALDSPLDPPVRQSCDDLEYVVPIDPYRLFLRSHSTRLLLLYLFPLMHVFMGKYSQEIFKIRNTSVIPAPLYFSFPKWIQCHFHHALLPSL